MLKNKISSQNILCLFPNSPWSPSGIVKFNILKPELLLTGKQASMCQLTQKAYCSWRLKKCICSAATIILKFPSFSSVPVGHMIKHASQLRPHHLFWNLCSLNVSTTWSCFSSSLIGVWEEAVTVLSLLVSQIADASLPKNSILMDMLV